MIIHVPSSEHRDVISGHDIQTRDGIISPDAWEVGRKFRPPFKVHRPTIDTFELSQFLKHPISMGTCFERSLREERADLFGIDFNLRW